MSSMLSMLRPGVLFVAMVAASCGSRQEGTAPLEQRSHALSGPIFTETWEGGTDGWTDRSGSPPVLVADPEAPSNTVQEIFRATSGGDYFSPLVDIMPGEVYCVSTRVKWVSGGAPFLGIERFDASANQLDLNWLIGAPYTDPLGPVSAVSPSTTGWQTVSHTLTMPTDTTHIRLVSELYGGASKGGGDLAYLDDIATAAGACAGAASVPYVQGWESGAGGWADKTGGAPTLVTDATSPSGSKVQMVDRATAGGDYFSPQIDVTGGEVYCVSTLVKWVSGGAPFLGVQRFDSGGSAVDLNWLIGASYTDPLGPVTEVSPSASGWQTVSHTLTMPAGTTQIRLVSELYGGASKGGADLAYLDDIAIGAGACVPYVQGWESGIGGWADKSGGAPTLVTDATSPSGSTVQMIDRATAGGDYFSPQVNVAAGNSYCVSALVKWVSGGAPFLGIQRFDGGGNAVDLNWLIGVSYTDPLGPATEVSTSATGWQTISRTLSMPAGTTQIRLVSELYGGASKGDSDLAYLDDVGIATGACAAAASVPYVQDWESGTGGWMDRAGSSPTLATDGTSPSGPAVQSIDRATAGGDYFSPWINVTGGQTYCASIAVRWLGGGTPFVGLQPSTSTGPVWLIGASGYADAFGPVQPVSASEPGWQQFQYTLVMPAGATQARFSVELYSGETKPGANLAYFDGIRLVSGSCAQLPGPDPAPEPRPDAASMPDVPPPSRDAGGVDGSAGSGHDAASTPDAMMPVFVAAGGGRGPLSTSIYTDHAFVDQVPTVNKQTMRVMLRTTVAGSQVAIKLTNRFSSVALPTIGAAHLAIRSSGGSTVSGSDRTLTFGGAPTVSIAAGGEVWSDPVSLAVSRGQTLAISLYIDGKVTPTTESGRGPSSWMHHYLSSTGDHTSETTMPGTTTTPKIPFVAEVSVLPAAPAATLVALGDSITEGACATAENGDWPDLLSDRLPTLPDGTPVSMFNAGIGSGRFESSDGAGLSGIKRLPELLALPSVRWITILMGVNDISYDGATAANLIAAYQSAITLSHTAGVKVVGIPILPFRHSVKDVGTNWATAQTVNAWIRSSGKFDAVIDFEPVVGDPTDPGSMKASLTADHVHPNQAGYNAMANSIDLSIFR